MPDAAADMRPFDPKMLSLARSAFNRVLVESPASFETTEACLAGAQRVLRAVAGGISDPAKLRQAALGTEGSVSS